MFSSGKTKPDSRIDGISEMKIAASIAVCMVSAIVDTNTPTPSDADQVEQREDRQLEEAALDRHLEDQVAGGDDDRPDR